MTAAFLAIAGPVVLALTFVKAWDVFKGFVQ